MFYNKLTLTKRVVTLATVLQLLSALISYQYVYAQPDLNDLREIWKEEKYSEALPLLIEYRQNPYGRNPEVDYMIATSACRIPEYQDRGEKCFEWILSNYSLDKGTTELVIKEMNFCSSAQEPESIAFLNDRVATSVGVRGKTFYWLDQENALTSVPVEVIEKIDYAEFSKRLFKYTESETSITYLHGFLDSDFSSYSTQHFVVISLAGHPESNLEKIGLKMEKVLNFYCKNYKIPTPEYLITIFLVPDPNNLQKLAGKLHGIRVSDNSIGYSFQNDLSIIGIIQSNNTYTGTLAHELFHLMVRNHFGDIPPWMDEGIAALYEVSEIENDTVIGLVNWRGRVLERFWNKRPSIEELVQMSWESFDAAEWDYEAEKQATNHATARYFVLYLQETGKLANVYSAFQKREILEVNVDPKTDSVIILESVLDENISKVDNDFEKWFLKLDN